jgi:hypothetical protein
MSATNVHQVFIQNLQTHIAPLRERIINHPVYREIEDLEDLRLFMESHVFAVWDFMSLLKALQQQLTCTTTPWFPVGAPDTRYLINEIVTGEESDIDEQGCRMSHFEMYLAAMTQCQADTSAIQSFLEHLRSTKSLENALIAAKVPAAAANFVRYTFEVIASGQAHIQAAVFTFGREDLIPAMFHSLVADLREVFPDSINKFAYYLERHIEVDGEHHSHLALEMVAQLCGENPQCWQEAKEAAAKALEYRIALWDEVRQQIQQNRMADLV